MLLQHPAPSQLKNLNPPISFTPSVLTFFRKHLHLELHRLVKQHGNVFQIQAAGKRILVVSGLEAIREALVKQQEACNSRADFAVFKLAPQRHFLELKSGETWERHHSIVGQAMHSFVISKSNTIEQWVNEEATDLANTLLKFNGQPLDPDRYLPLATLNFMQRLIFGERNILADIKEDTAFVKTARNLKHIPKVIDAIKLEFIAPKWQPLFKASRLNIMRNFIRGVTALETYVNENVEEHQKTFNPETLRDITDGLIQASRELTDRDRNELELNEQDVVNGSLMQFAGAGGGLSSIILRWAVLYLAAYPDVQERIYQELTQVVGDEQLSFKQHRGKLPLTEACIHEILRHSSITTMPPINYATTADITLDGYCIPKNTPLVINYYGLTRDARYFPEPEKFDLDRFLNSEGKLRNDLTDKFCPFGVGARRCVAEYLGRFLLFHFLTNLVSQCKFEPVSGEKLSLEPDLGVFVIPKSYRVIVKPRS